MKKTYNINISGYGFVIDDDAYHILYDYLITLDEICTKAGEPEISTDIEQRIAEIFNEHLAHEHRMILTMRDVEEVIARMGRPEEIVDVEIEEAEPSRETPEAPEAPQSETPRNPFGRAFNHPTRKRLFRDTESAVFGGVCAGLGWYLGVDPVWIRIIWVVLALITGSTLAWIYIILWICVPAAKTPYQRMQMMGIDSSVGNVGKVVTGDYSGAASSGLHSGIAKGVLLFFLIIALLVVGSFLLALGAALFGCLIALCVPMYEFSTVGVPNPKLVLGCVVGGALVAGIPAFLLFRCIISAMRARELTPLSGGQWVLLGVFWLLGLASVITCGLLI